MNGPIDKTSQSIIYFMLKRFHQIRMTVSKIFLLICGQYGLELLSNRWSQFSGHLLSDENSIVSKSDCDCESRSFFWENWENHNLLLRLSDLYLDIESGTFHEYQTSWMHVYLEVVYHLHIRICVLQYLAKVFKFLLQNSNSF